MTIEPHQAAQPGSGVVRSRLTIGADVLAVRELTGWLADLLASAGPEAALLQGRVELAVHEVCMNIVDHAYGAEHVSRPDDICIDGVLAPDAVRIQVRDRGEGFDLDAVARPVPGVPQIRGYGLVIVEKLVDELGYHRNDTTNTWSLRFDRAADSQEKRQ